MTWQVEALQLDRAIRELLTQRRNGRLQGLNGNSKESKAHNQTKNKDHFFSLIAQKSSFPNCSLNAGNSRELMQRAILKSLFNLTVFNQCDESPADCLRWWLINELIGACSSAVH